MTRISRLTPPLRLTAAMPGTDSNSLATVLSIYQLSCSTVMSLAIAE